MLKHRQTFVGHTHCVYSVAVSPCGRYLASGSLDKSVRIWQLQRNRQLYRFVEGTDSVRLVGWLDECRLYAASYSPIIRIYRPLQGTLANIMQDSCEIEQIGADERGGCWMFTLNCRGGLSLWNSRRDRKISEVFAESSLRISCFCRVPQSLRCFIASSDNRIGLATFEGAGDAIEWRAEHSNLINCLTLSHDRLTLAVGDDEGIVSLYHAQEFECIKRLVCSNGWILTLAFSPDDKEIATAGQDTAVYLWSTKTFKQLATADNHRNWIACLYWAEPRWLISSGQDNSIQLYEGMNSA